MHWQVVFTDEARQEFNQLPAREQSAMIHPLDKLAAAEAQADKRGCGRAVAAAQARLDLIEEDQT